MSSFLAVGIGAMLGAWLRWGLGIWFNPIFPALPLGTLTANIAGGYLIGLAIAWLAEHPGIPPEVRLLIITGFLGGLTTFSTFSAEVVTALSRGLWLWGGVTVFVHMAGSFVATGLGFMTLKVLK